jgi:hypothetical protein
MDRIQDFIYIEVELFREYLGASVAVDSKSYEQAVHVYHESRGLVPEGYIKASKLSISSLLSSLPR